MAGILRWVGVLLPATLVVVASMKAQTPTAADPTTVPTAIPNTPPKPVVGAGSSAAPAPGKALIDDMADPNAPRKGLKRLTPEYEVWLDPKEKQVVMTGTVVLRRGPLELFACLKHTKEHESIVAVETKAYVVHAALLACGAEAGNPAKFLPEFTPARGTEVEVIVSWTDADGTPKTMDARQWLRNVRTGEALKYPWVFGGSGFWRDPADGKQYYQAEEGDFICISNFSTAMLDLPIESPQTNAALLFEAFTENIPADGTKVLITLKPKLDKQNAKPDDATKPGANEKSQAKPKSAAP